jgi:hypothetical protein
MITRRGVSLLVCRSIAKRGDIFKGPFNAKKNEGAREMRAPSG